jgi:hypothetical protein
VARKAGPLGALAAGHLAMELCLSVPLLSLLDLAQIVHRSSLDIIPEDRVVFGVGIGYREMTARGSV